jgi:hypothetical protein
MRVCLCVLAAVAFCAAAEPQMQTLDGKLILTEGQPPLLETTAHKIIHLEGDDTTRSVLADVRLNGFTVQAKGRFTAPDKFLIDPSHTRSMLVRQAGKLKMVTYWCEVCHIRAYTPGPCVCCFRETTLDLRDPNEIE